MGWRVVASAGLWDRWKAPDLGEELLDSYDSAERNDGNDHDRMPVILDPSNYNLRLDPGMTKSASGIRKSIRSASSTIRSKPLSRLGQVHDILTP
jgi:putative SOS response-associated peptidase YedK